MSCLRMEDAFSISNSSAKASKSAGLLFLRSCSFIACRPSWTVMETPRAEIGPMKRALAPETIHREVVGTRTSRLALASGEPLPRGSEERTCYSLIWNSCKYGEASLGRGFLPRKAEPLAGEDVC